MFSVIDELCMHVYINVRRFHWILLLIRVDEGVVEVMDSLRKDMDEYLNLQELLQR